MQVRPTTGDRIGLVERAAVAAPGKCAPSMDGEEDVLAQVAQAADSVNAECPGSAECHSLPGAGAGSRVRRRRHAPRPRAAAINGAFGDVRFTGRTSGNALFVNPLMAIYFTVDLDKLAARCLYLDRIENTIGRRQVIGRIQTFRDELASARIPRAFPH
jgi:hypothetical protein